MEVLTSIEKHVIENVLPDGVYWFAGFYYQVVRDPRGGEQRIPLINWSPSFQQAEQMDLDKANTALSKIATTGCKIVPVRKAQVDKSAVEVVYGEWRYMARKVRARKVKEGMILRVPGFATLHKVTAVGKVLYLGMLRSDLQLNGQKHELGRNSKQWVLHVHTDKKMPL